MFFHCDPAVDEICAFEREASSYHECSSEKDTEVEDVDLSLTLFGGQMTCLSEAQFSHL